MPWTIFDTAIGPCGLAWNDVGLTCVQLPESTREKTKERLVSKAKERGGGDVGTRPASSKTTPPWVTKAIDRVRAHLDGDPQDLRSVPLDFAGIAPFTKKVYQALQGVPAGSTVSYGELAKQVGSPGASRAIGRAMATNPFPIFVPCQRVLASTGKGGFSAWGGVVTKDRILAIEGFRPDEAAALADDEAQTPLFAAMSSDALPYDARAAVKHLASVDPKLRDHLERIGAFTLSLKQTEGTFAALAESIVYQQLNGKAAATIFGRVRALFPKGRLDPKALLQAKDADLRAAGLSRNKLAALRDLAKRTDAGEVPTLPQLAKMDDDAIVAKLSEVRGIGRWTVEMLLIFRLGRPDVLPLADYGIKKGFARVFHPKKRQAELPSGLDLERRGERWRPFRSVASWYLWRAAEMS